MGREAAFQPMGKTFQANANTVSSVITITPDGPCSQLLVASHENSSTGKPLYFRISNSSTVTVTAPTTSTSSYALLVVPSSIRAYTVPFQFSPSNPLYVAIIAESGTAECYFTPGEGL